MSVEWTGRIQVHHPDPAPPEDAPGHRLISFYFASPRPSTHECLGCGWEVTTYTKPGQATAAAVQAAYNAHLHIWARVIECDYCGATEADHLPGGECPVDVERPAGRTWCGIHRCGREADHDGPCEVDGAD